MFVSVHHSISNPAEFWRAIERIEADGAPSSRVRSILRNDSGDRAVILWEAESMDSARQFVESLLGQFSENEYEPVKSAKSWGITP